MSLVEPLTVTERVLREWPLPEPATDKDSRGQLLVVGGSAQTAGAVLLAGEAALRAGAGKVRIATAGSVVGAVGVAVPESLVMGLDESDDGVVLATAADTVVAAADQLDAVLIGPGLLDVGTIVELLSRIVPRLGTNVVIDALASAYVTEHPDGLRHLAGRSILTVNPTELSRVLDRDEDEVTEDPVRAASDAAERTGAVVVCGGSDKTIVAPEGGCWLVKAGGPGLGASGSGDVQSGLVAGLLAQGAEPAQAAVWGAYLHGRAGDRLAASVGRFGFLARELSPQVPHILAEITS